MGIGNFMPNFMNYTGQGAFRYWCQTVLPLVYDDSLSYYELLNKMVVYLNNCIKDVSTAESNLEELRGSFGSLNEAVNTKYDELKTSNENLTSAYNEFYNWFNTLDVQDEINNKLDALVEDGTIPNMVEEVVNTSTAIQQTIADWLADYAETSGITAPAVDDTLTISGAAADAKTVGDKGFLQRTLSSGDDLNNLLTPGFYNASSTVYQSILHYPEGASNGRLLVFTTKNSHVNTLQILFDTNMRIFYRLGPSGTTWNAWKQIARDSDVPVIKTIETEIELEEASIPTSTGKWASNSVNFGKSVGTLSRIKIEGADYLAVSWTAKNTGLVNNVETWCDRLAILQYDKDGTLLTATIKHASSGTPDTGERLDEITLNSGTVSIAISVYNDGVGSTGLPNNKITLLTKNCVPKIEKNPAFGSNVSGTRWYRFGYKVGEYVDKTTGEMKPIYNTGMMILPSNYDVNGKAVPLIVNVHGSAAYLSLMGTQIADYEPFYNYLADCGYAIIDCYGWTDKYPSSSMLSNPWPMPTSCKAYLKLIDIITENFNVDKDNLYMMCKSLGGLMCQWLSGVIPFKAVGYLAPALMTNFGYSGDNYRIPMVDDLGLVGTVNAELGWESESDCINDFVTNYRNWNTAKRTAFYLANEQQIMGWSPEFKNLIGKTAQEMLEYSAAKDQTQTSLTKINYPPTKIWYANDDDAISPPSCNTLAQQIRNGGGVGIARIMPNGTGGHHSVDTDTNALQKTGVTTPLGVTYATIPLAYYEMWEFFEAYRI